MKIKRPMTEEELRKLPVSFDLPTAGRALGIGSTKAYQMARADQFPIPVLPVGREFRCTKAHLFRYLGMEMAMPPADEKPAA